jgi:hypothetical protein
MPLPHSTIETCEGIACRDCHLHIDFCTCHPDFECRPILSLAERISGQGWVPQTPEAEA